MRIALSQSLLMSCLLLKTVRSVVLYILKLSSVDDAHARERTAMLKLWRRLREIITRMGGSLRLFRMSAKQ